MSSYFQEYDGDNEDSLWRHEPDRPDYPTQMLRKCDLPPVARHLWDTIVDAVIA